MQSRLIRKSLYLLAKFVAWRGRPRPPRMSQNGRDVDPLFADSEKLYMRCMSEWIDENGRVKPAYIRFDQSVNRDKYGKSYDVLMPADDDEASKDWIFWGVAAFTKQVLPDPICTGGGKKQASTEYRFSIEHVPLPENFGHAEVCIHKNKERERRQLGETVKKAYRTKLSEGARLIIRPVI